MSSAVVQDSLWIFPSKSRHEPATFAGSTITVSQILLVNMEIRVPWKNVLRLATNISLELFFTSGKILSCKKSLES